MRTLTGRTRIISTGAYLVIALVVLYLYADPYFCSLSKTGQSRLLVSVKLALVCSFWDLAAGWAAVTMFRHVGRTIPALFAAIIVAVGLASTHGFPFFPS